ncbi:MAG TPA: hypothetical protein VFP87_03555, partial [Chitinophagaceae bacterium]|nr:hypothetical protein [Chitinophagaceae bacterium]
VYALGVLKAISDDGGKTWKQWNPTDTTGDWTHGDNHALWFDEENPDRIIVGNDGGVIMTNNRGVKWKNFFDKIPTTQFYTVTYDMEKPFNVFGAVQDEGTMTGSVLNNPARKDSMIRRWKMAPGGEGTQVQVDPENSNIVFSSSYYGRLMKSDMAKPDSLWSNRIKMFSVGAIDSLRGEWLAGTLISRFDHNKIYHGLQHLYRSADGGETWSMISPDLTYNDKTKMGVYPYLIYHQAITSLAEGENPGIVYAGTDDGRVWLTMDDGKKWKEITPGLPFNKHVATITASKFNAGRVYVVLNDRRQDNQTPYIFESDNYGKNWKSIAGNLPLSPVNVIIENPEKQNTLYCGTDMGIYMTKEGGKKWFALNANMPASVAVDDMFIHPRDKKLVIGTYGRGVWVLDRLP